MSRTLAQWLSYLQTIHQSSIDLGLSRILPLAKQIQALQFPCPVITVAGTNGKGSCVKILESIYLAAGYRVGAYTSPQLLEFNERIRINGCNIDDVSLVSALAHIEQIRGEQSISFFEFTTLAALSIFQQSTLDVLLLEVGLGGRLDAVNVVEPDVAVVTSIGLDHQDWLGSSVEAIAREKAGIFRSAKPAICGQPNPPATLIAHAQSIGAQYLQIDQDFHYRVDAQSWHWEGPTASYANLPLPNLKCQNTATSVMALTSLQDRLPVATAAIHQGLRGAQLPGRFERRELPEVCFFDVAHNEPSVRWLAEQLANNPVAGKTIAVFSMLADKDIEACIAAIKAQIDTWFIAPLSQIERSASLQQLTACCRAQRLKSWYNRQSLALALQDAIAACQGELNHRIVVFGSFHTVAQAYQVLRSEAPCKIT